MRSRLTDSLLLGPWRRRRAMRQRLAELDRLDAGIHPRGTGRSLGAYLSAAAAAAFVAAGGLLLLHQATGLNVSFAGITRPVPLGTPLPAPPGHGGYAFQQTQPGDPSAPAAYSPCKPIHVVVNADQEPVGARGLVEEGLTEIGQITGLHFVMDGNTTEQPQEKSARTAGQPALIAWTTPDQVSGLAGRVAGLGGSTATMDQRTHRLYLISGQVALDAPAFAQILERPTGRSQALAIVLHELGHLVGLDHVNDSSQLMYRDNVGVLDFQGGDRRGLELLGTGPCIG